MSWKAAAILLAALASAACAATTPPPRFSAVSPADPDAPEAATPPATPLLTGAPDAKAPPSPTPTPSPHHHHEGGR
jgi:hypothetical protein